MYSFHEQSPHLSDHKYVDNGIDERAGTVRYPHQDLRQLRQFLTGFDTVKHEHDARYAQKHEIGEYQTHRYVEPRSTECLDETGWSCGALVVTAGVRGDGTSGFPIDVEYVGVGSRTDGNVGDV